MIKGILSPLLLLFDHVTTQLCVISGGWLLISNAVIDGSSVTPKLSVETSYRGISNYRNNQTFLETIAMKELRTHLSFTQLRFHCSKQQGRTFHVATVTNSTGEAVVQYFSGETDVQPDACGSFHKMENDNSKLAGVCDHWGNNGTNYNVSKWGHDRNHDRLYYYTAFVVSSFHWMLDSWPWMCDDSRLSLIRESTGDFWKVFVR